jgi:3-oxoacyl-[acyl-carrier protein] reductase/7-alpha-hydroxysteroid dehydrogenase/pteridine reductase
MTTEATERAEVRPAVSHLNGKVCLVTGASRGLGAEIARTLGRYGAKVAVNYLQAEAAARALCAEISQSGGEAIPIQADVSDPADVARLIETTWNALGAIDLLVNNAGPFDETRFLELSVETFDYILATNVRSTFLLTQQAGRRMKARGEGCIVHVTATDQFHRSHSVYGLAKAGMTHLTEAMALELAPEVRVHAVAPDLIADNEDMEPDFVARSIAGTPMRRLVTRAEIAEAVCLLSLPAFAMSVGHTLILDGGRSLPRLAFAPASP